MKLSPKKSQYSDVVKATPYAKILLRQTLYGIKIVKILRKLLLRIQCEAILSKVTI